MNNPYKPPSMPSQEEDDPSVNDIYKEFVIWGVFLAALFFLLDSIRGVIHAISKSIMLVVRYVVDLNN